MFPPRLAPPAHKIFIVTYHKSGTVWMMSVFNGIADELGWRFFYGPRLSEPDLGADVLFHGHGGWDFGKIPGDLRGIQLVRDPRDMIVSGCMYHMKAWEPWLHEPDPQTGKTYQQKLLEADPDERLMIEIERTNRNSISALRAWDDEDPRFLRVKYEDLINDDRLHHFHRIFDFLELPSEALPAAFDCAWKNSLFSGQVNRPIHVRTGQPGDWRNHFKARHKQAVQEACGDLLVRLGYEEDASWVKE